MRTIVLHGFLHIVAAAKSGLRSVSEDVERCLSMVRAPCQRMWEYLYMNRVL